MEAASQEHPQEGATGFERLEQLDRQMARAARSAGALRLAIGVGLEELGKGGYRELGFPSLAAYALERCERRARWVEQSRSLARRTAELPILRGALVSGAVSWSQAAVIAAVASPADEAEWVSAAGTQTVRELTERAKARAGGKKHNEADDAAGDGPTCTLTVTVNAEEAWLFECTTMMVRHLDGQGTRLADVLEATLLEGAGSLGPSIPGDHAEPDYEAASAAQRAYEAEREAWRLEAEKRCEGRIPRDPIRLDVASDAAMQLDGSSEDIDARVREVSTKLASLSVRLGDLAEAFFHADGWRRLGYATARQYTRERLGMSLSSLDAKRRLARGICRLPGVGESLRARDLGLEAARLVTGVATPATEAAWVARAEERTIVHLREEVRAAELLCRIGIRGNAEPPSDETIAAVRELEFQIITGEGVPQKVGTPRFACLPRAYLPAAGQTAATTVTSRNCEPVARSVSIAANQMSAALIPCTANHGAERALHAEPALIQLQHALASAGKPLRPFRSMARTTLRFRVPEEVRRLYRHLERLYNRFGRPSHQSFLAYCSSELMASWAHDRPPVAYASVYRRDGHRCQNPVCGRNHVTPHHIVFRSRGGSDDDSNVISLCAECHLEGVHGGHIAVTGEAGEPRWVLGRTGDTVINGRRRGMPLHRDVSASSITYPAPPPTRTRGSLRAQPIENSSRAASSAPSSKYD